MIPAAGWYVTYDGIENHFDPVACFALIEETLENGVAYQLAIAMTVDEGVLTRVDQCSNIAGVHYLPNYQPEIPGMSSNK